MLSLATNVSECDFLIPLVFSFLLAAAEEYFVSFDTELAAVLLPVALLDVATLLDLAGIFGSDGCDFSLWFVALAAEMDFVLASFATPVLDP